MKLYNIYYKEDMCGNSRTYEGTTNNFKKWLKNHNDERIASGNMPEDESEFDCEMIHVECFN